MLEFVTLSQNIPFTVAITVVIIIAFLEGVSSLLGAGISSLINSLFVDTDFDIHLDM